jgi:hypothetical protein
MAATRFIFPSSGTFTFSFVYFFLTISLAICCPKILIGRTYVGRLLKEFSLGRPLGLVHKLGSKDASVVMEASRACALLATVLVAAVLACLCAEGLCRCSSVAAGLCQVHLLKAMAVLGGGGRWAVG